MHSIDQWVADAEIQEEATRRSLVLALGDIMKISPEDAGALLTLLTAYLQAYDHLERIRLHQRAAREHE